MRARKKYERQKNVRHGMRHYLRRKQHRADYDDDIESTLSRPSFSPP